MRCSKYSCIFKDLIAVVEVQSINNPNLAGNCDLDSLRERIGVKI